MSDDPTMPNGKEARECSPEYVRRVKELFARMDDPEDLSDEEARVLLQEVIELNRKEAQWARDQLTTRH
jgi:rRNA maturation endonuclease Nob1